MSWYGIHPQYSKNQIKSLLPPATCKHCVYWFRVVVGSSPDSSYQEHANCSRCGICQFESLAQLNERLLGLVATRVASLAKAPSSAPEPARAKKCLTAGSSSRLGQWIQFYQSANREITFRAAKALLNRTDVPLWILLDILDKYSNYGFGAAAERALKLRRDGELLGEMLTRLDSPEYFVREVACGILGGLADYSATPHLLRMIDDPHVMVRHAAGFALAQLKRAREKSGE